VRAMGGGTLDAQHDAASNLVSNRCPACLGTRRVVIHKFWIPKRATHRSPPSQLRTVGSLGVAA